MSEFVRGLSMMLHGHLSEFMWGFQALWGLPLLAEGLLVAANSSSRKPPASEAPSPVGLDQVVAGTVAYGYYIAAAAMVGAHIPDFLRDHLFDGFAPAVLVGFLMYRIRTARARLSAIPLLYVQSAAVFGLIAAAAIFTSGKHDYVPVLYAAFIGGWAFPLFIRVAKSISKQMSKDTIADAGPKNAAKTISGSSQPGAGDGMQAASAPAGQDQL